MPRAKQWSIGEDAMISIKALVEMMRDEKNPLSMETRRTIANRFENIHMNAQPIIDLSDNRW